MSMFEDFMPPHGLDGDTEFMPLFSMEEEDELQNNEEYDEVLPVSYTHLTLPTKA